MKYQHEAWEHTLNQYIRKNAREWDKVRQVAIHMGKAYLAHHEDKELSILVEKHIF